MSKSRARDSLNSDSEKRPTYNKRGIVTQKGKTAFRNSSTWQKYRKYRKAKGGSIDYITHRPLKKKWSLHHLDLDSKHYTDISNGENFVTLNEGMHEIVHQLYSYYEEDPSVMKRLEEVLSRMRKINYIEKQTQTTELNDLPLNELLKVDDFDL